MRYDSVNVKRALRSLTFDAEIVARIVWRGHKLTNNWKPFNEDLCAQLCFVVFCCRSLARSHDHTHTHTLNIVHCHPIAM